MWLRRRKESPEKLTDSVWQIHGPDFHGPPWSMISLDELPHPSENDPIWRQFDAEQFRKWKKWTDKSVFYIVLSTMDQDWRPQTMRFQYSNWMFPSGEPHPPSAQVRWPKTWKCGDTSGLPSNHGLHSASLGRGSVKRATEWTMTSFWMLLVGMIYIILYLYSYTVYIYIYSYNKSGARYQTYSKNDQKNQMAAAET